MEESRKQAPSKTGNKTILENNIKAITSSQRKNREKFIFNKLLSNEVERNIESKYSLSSQPLVSSNSFDYLEADNKAFYIHSKPKAHSQEYFTEAFNPEAQINQHQTNNEINDKINKYPQSQDSGKYSDKDSSASNEEYDVLSDSEASINKNHSRRINWIFINEVEEATGLVNNFRGKYCVDDDITQIGYKVIRNRCKKLVKLINSKEWELVKTSNNAKMNTGLGDHKALRKKWISKCNQGRFEIWESDEAGAYAAAEVDGEFWIIGCISGHPFVFVEEFHFGNSDGSTGEPSFNRYTDPKEIAKKLEELTYDYTLNQRH